MTADRKLAARWLVLGASLIAAACSNYQDQPVYPNLGGDKYPNVGLYTPGSTLGVKESSEAPVDAGTDAAMIADATGDRCVGAPGADGPPGGLIVDYMTQIIDPHMKWQPTNVGAVWIETASGTYIKTLERWAGIRGGSLYQWTLHACTAKWPEVEVVTGATLSNHSRPHHATWSGKDFNGKLVADGTYELLIETAQSEAGGPLVKYEFEKGPMSQPLQEADMFPYKGVTISYMPMAAE